MVVKMREENAMLSHGERLGIGNAFCVCNSHTYITTKN
jgi:hypothetical protein